MNTGDTGDTYPFIQFLCFSQWKNCWTCELFGMGLKVHWNASRSVQRHTDASIWAARMLWLSKHPLRALRDAV